MFRVKSRFFKNRELYWSTLPQNSNCGRELVQKSGVQIPVGESQIFFVRFLFIFISSIKNWKLTHEILFFIFFYQLNFINILKKNILFLFNLLIYLKVSLFLIFSFLWRIWKWKQNETNKFLPKIWILKNLNFKTDLLAFWAERHAQYTFCPRPDQPGRKWMYHCWYIEPRNREKSLTLIWQHFSCLLAEWIAKISKKKFFHGGFLR